MLEGFVAAGEIVMREAALFAAIGFLLLGLGDGAIDLIWLGRTSWRRWFRREWGREPAPPA